MDLDKALEEIARQLEDQDLGSDIPNRTPLIPSGCLAPPPPGLTDQDIEDNIRAVMSTRGRRGRSR